MPDIFLVEVLKDIPDKLLTKFIFSIKFNLSQIPVFAEDIPGDLGQNR